MLRLSVSKVMMLPQSLEAATALMMRQGSVAREVLGDDFVDHFGGTREHEVGLWNSAVTNWEGQSRSRHPPPLDSASLTGFVVQWNDTWNPPSPFVRHIVCYLMVGVTRLDAILINIDAKSPAFEGCC